MTCAWAQGGAAFLRIPAGFRADSLGEQGATLEGVDAAFWNPAGLAGMSSAEAALHGRAHFAGMRRFSAAVGLPVRSAGVFSVSLLHFGSGGMDGFDADGRRTASVSETGWAAGLLWARAWSLRSILLRGGAGFRILRQELAGLSAGTFSGDAGLQVIRKLSATSRLIFGLSFLDLGGPLRFDSEGFRPSRRLRLGVSYQTRMWGEPVGLFAELSGAEHRNWRGHFGLEHGFGRTVWLRVGGLTSPGSGPGVRAGLSVRIGPTETGYAASLYGDLGSGHSAGLILRRDPTETRRTLQNRLDRGAELAARGRWEEAFLEYDKALEEDPENTTALEGMRSILERLRENP